MVYNSVVVLTVAHKSADVWQRLACIGDDRVTSHQLLDLVCCFPLHQLGRFALCLWTFLCLPPPDTYYYSPYSYADDRDSDSDSDPDSEPSVSLGDYYYNSHSD